MTFLVSLGLCWNLEAPALAVNTEVMGEQRWGLGVSEKGLGGGSLWAVWIMRVCCGALCLALLEASGTACRWLVGSLTATYLAIQVDPSLGVSGPSCSGMATPALWPLRGMRRGAREMRQMRALLTLHSCHYAHS